jgi:hypothetical protein
MVDTHVENRFGDRLYLCASCVRLDGIALGLIRGKQHTQLLAVAKRESELGREVEALNMDRDQIRAELQHERVRATSLEADLAVERQRSEQLRAALEGEIAAKQATLQAVS